MKPLIPTLSVMVTYQCNIECKHCGPYCSPRDTEWMTVEEIRDLVQQAAQLGAYNVVFTGGEPTLLKKLPEVIRYTKRQAGIGSTRIVTNGKWATTYDGARAKLGELQDAGLDEINISCGEYHQEFVPISSVANAYRAAIDLGFETVLLAGEFIKEEYATVSPADFERAVGEALLDPEYNSPYTSRFHGMTCGRAMRQGRGKQEIEASVVELSDETEFTGICREVYTAITVHPNGNTTACCGVMTRAESLLNIGNWRSTRLQPLLEDANHDLILNWIRYLGLHDMKRWLVEQRPSLKLPDKFSTICDLCAELVYNPEVQQTLIQLGAERSAEIVAAKIAFDSVESAPAHFRY